MMMYRDQEAPDSMFHTNARALRLRWPYVPLPVEEGG